MSEHEIRVVSTVQSGVVTLRPSGEIGTHEAPTLRQHVKQAMDQQPRRVVVDLSDVNYMSTAGLATLVEGLQRSKRDNIEFVLCGLQDRVRSVFEISRLTSVFRVVDSAQDAAQ